MLLKYSCVILLLFFVLKAASQTGGYGSGPSRGYGSGSSSGYGSGPSTGGYGTGPSTGYWTSPAPAVDCTAANNRMLCNNSVCLYSYQRCNNYNDCSDGSDEHGCTCDAINGKFQCNNGKCIYNSSVCNTHDECGDGSDEKNCPCDQSIKFLCSNGKCLNKYVRCNLDNNCGDNSDELGCFSGDVILYGGYEKSVGYLLIKINDTWYNADSSGWTNFESNIACKGLGYTRGHIASYSDLNYNVYNGMRLKVNVTCNQQHRTDRITDCDMNIVTSRYSTNGVALRCDNGPNPIRLVGGNSSYGRLQFQINGNWTTVCADGWSDLNSEIVCKSLGFMYGVLTDNIQKTQIGDDVPIGLDNVRCVRSDVNISDCDSSPFYVHNCRHLEDVFLKCYPTCHSSDKRFLCANGNCIESSKRCNLWDDCGDNSDEQNCECDLTYYNFKCDDGRCLPSFRRCNYINECSDASDEAGCECLRLNQFHCKNSAQCTPFSNVCNNVNDCPNGGDEVGCDVSPKALRLVGGNETFGRLQIQIGSTWASVCENYWSYLNSRLACNQLGFRYGSRVNNQYWISAGLDSPIGLGDVRCNTTDRYISECSHLPYFQTNCFHNQDIFLSCFDECNTSNNRFKCNNGDCIPLYNRCDMYDHCSDGSDETECSCQEKHLFQCPNSSQCLSYTNICNNVNDCPNGGDEENCQQVPKPLRLVGGNGTYGLLQIQIGNLWTTVCDDYWSDLNSRLACKQLGYSNGIMVFNSFNISDGLGAPIGLDDVQCNSTVQYISECNHRPFLQHDCNHFEDIFLVCSNG